MAMMARQRHEYSNGYIPKGKGPISGRTLNT